MGQLYEIAERYRNLLILLEDESIDNSILMDSLAQIEDEFNEKIKNIVHLVKDFEYHCNYLQMEEQRLNKKRKTLEKKIENLKMYIDSNLKLKGSRRIDVGTFTITVRKNPPKVEVVEFADIPAEFIKSKTEYSVDRKGILDTIRLGGKVPGVQLIQSESLVIR